MANLSDFSRFGHLIGDDEKRVLLDGRAELEGENFFTGFYQKLWPVKIKLEILKFITTNWLPEIVIETKSFSSFPLIASFSSPQCLSLNWGQTEANYNAIKGN